MRVVAALAVSCALAYGAFPRDKETECVRLLTLKGLQQAILAITDYSSHPALRILEVPQAPNHLWLAATNTMKAALETQLQPRPDMNIDIPAILLTPIYPSDGPRTPQLLGSIILRNPFRNSTYHLMSYLLEKLDPTQIEMETVVATVRARDLPLLRHLLKMAAVKETVRANEAINLRGELYDAASEREREQIADRRDTAGDMDALLERYGVAKPESP